ncbi:putative transporter C4B3.13 [Fusarium oxysporum f. sp. albedinis]|nr:putative transporter C4B3.13 [Fusarium oxysporum f. sp. albedinis]
MIALRRLVLLGLINSSAACFDSTPIGPFISTQQLTSGSPDYPKPICRILSKYHINSFHWRQSPQPATKRRTGMKLRHWEHAIRPACRQIMQYAKQALSLNVHMAPTSSVTQPDKERI